MQATEKPREELARAKAAIAGMRAAQTFADFEEHWLEFLKRIDRVWNKAEAHYSRSPKWGSWGGKVSALRSKDDLLRYLIQARNVEEHSVAPILEHAPGSMAINPGPSGVLHIEKLEIKGGNVFLDTGGTEAIVKITPSRPKLLPVTNRGRTYQAPGMHQGENIDPLDVLGVAEIGLKFYEKFASDAEMHFVK